jgi:hypothetical protein
MQRDAYRLFLVPLWYDEYDDFCGVLRNNYRTIRRIIAY